MRVPPRACLVVILAAVLASSPVQAFPIGEQEYTADTPFAVGVKDIGNATFLSGALTASLADASGPYVLFNLTGFAITGVTKLCWLERGLPSCIEGALRLDVSQGGSVGLQFPTPASGSLLSRHSIAFFVDVGETLHFYGLDVEVDRDIAAVHVGGEMGFSRLPRMPTTATQDLAGNNAAGLVLIDADTRLTVQGAGPPRTLSGEQFELTFQGNPAIAPFGVGASLMPFQPGSTAAFSPADAEAAQQGIDLARVDALGRQLQGAVGDAGEQGESGLGAGLEQIQPLLGAILDGALLTLPGTLAGAPSPGPGAGADPDLAAVVGNITLLRFDHLTATSTSNGTVALSASGPLQIQGGRVVGAPGLLGILPWWCWLLWVAALGMWVARLVVKPAKENEQWDRLRWVGWVAGPVASLIVFWLWDGQVHKVWGLSLLGGNPGGASIIFLLLTEILIGAMVWAAVVLPLSSLLKSGARFAKQGRFMGLHRPTAMFLGFLLGTTLLLSYVDFLIGLVG